MLEVILKHELRIISDVYFDVTSATLCGFLYRVTIVHAGTTAKVEYEMPVMKPRQLIRFLRWTVSQKDIRHSMALKVVEEWNENDTINKKAKSHLN
jgi:hypothetical protein